VPPTVTLVTQTFGNESGLVVYGWVFASHQIGAAVVAVFAGAIRDHLDTYDPAFYISGLLCVIAALGVFAIRGPVKQRIRTSTPTPAPSPA
jgi:sugar phosphate permease